MEPVEAAIAISGLFSGGMVFAALREQSIDNIEWLHRLLLLNAAIGGILYGASAAHSVGGFVFWPVVVLGATEGGFWLGVLLDKMLPERKGEPGARNWKFRNDPLGCALAIVLGLAFLTIVTIVSDDDDDDYEAVM